MPRDVLERTDEVAIVLALERAGFKCRKDGKGGWPDQQVFIGNGLHFWVEAKKRKGGRLTAAQERVIPMLRARGDIVLIRPSVQQAVNTAVMLYGTRS